MIEIIGTELNQWDTGRTVKVSEEATHVHFANQGDSKAVIMEITGDLETLIPDYLLQTGKQLCVYAVANGVTIERKIFSVKKRERPENYVYDEDQRNFIYTLITDAQEATNAANVAAQNALDAANIAGQATAQAVSATNNADVATGKANEATDRANEAAFKAANTAKSLMVVGAAWGTAIHLDDAIDQYLVGCRIFGKTTQSGTPTPNAPVGLISSVYDGSISVYVEGGQRQEVTISVPNGMRGIRVSNGGNYTDANGQQWISDEIDFARGVFVQRIYRKVFTGEEDFAKSGQPGNYYLWKDTLAAPNDGNLLTGALCTRLVERVPDRLWDTIGDGFAISTAAPFHVHLRMESISTVEALQAQLREWANNQNPLSMVFKLATPIETPLSEEELAAYAALHTYKDNTTVSNDAGAWMDLEYVMDAKKYIDGLITGTIIPASVE